MVSYERLDRIANVVPVLAWAVLPGGGLTLAAHVSAGLFALLLLHVAARVALALVLGQVRAQLLPPSAAAAARSLVGGSVTWLALLVVFGAPLTSAHSDTLLFAVLLTCWTVWPAALAFGVSFEQWIAFFLAADASAAVAAVAAPAAPVADASLLARSLARRAYATAVGCWLGALVIPLDWDRPWQAWPVPCVYGALAGHVLGSVLL